MRGERLPDIGHTVRRTLVMRCFAAMHLTRVFERELEVERALAESSLETCQVHIDLIAMARLRRIGSTSMPLALGKHVVVGEEPRMPHPHVPPSGPAHGHVPLRKDTEGKAASPPPGCRWAPRAASPSRPQSAPGTERLPSTSNHGKQGHELVAVGR